MTREEAYNRIDAIIAKYEIDDEYVTITNFKDYDALRIAREILEQEPITIYEIPKDYKYDTETEDFLVYRHKYTGDEIHIERPVPLYRLDQELCEDCISRNDMLDAIGHGGIYTTEELQRIIKGLPLVQPQQTNVYELLNKIRMEILNNKVSVISYECDEGDQGLAEGYNTAIENVLEIIDKHYLKEGVQMTREEAIKQFKGE